MNNKSTNWSEKYRPSILEDVILPSRLKRQLIALRNTEQSYCLAFHGHAGCGKTTTARLINIDSTVIYNCATEGKADDISKLDRLCSSHTLTGGKRVVLLDEADNLKAPIQGMLKGIIDKFSSTTMFILTTNHISKLSEHLLSRFKEIDFSVDVGDVELHNELKQRLLHILNVEKIAYNISDVNAIAQKNFPDMRQAIIDLQFEYGLV